MTPPAPAATDFCIRGAELLTMDAAHGARPVRSDVRVRDGKIHAIGPALAVPPECTLIDGRGKLLMPGLVNAHTHSAETFFKGRYPSLPLELWLLYAYTYVGGPPIGERLLYLRTLLLAMESLRNGVTTLCDLFFDPGPRDDARLDIVFQAYRDAGIRANVSSSVADLPLLDGIPFADEATFPPSLRQRLAFGTPPDVRSYEAYCRRAFQRWHGQADGRLRFALSPSAPQRCSTEMLLACHGLAREYATPLHTHLLETQVQAVLAQQRDGQTLVATMRDIGILDRHSTLAHAVWLTEQDMDWIAEAGASVAHNPLSNLKLASGYAPVPQLLRRGVCIGLGTDGLASNDSARVFDAMRVAGLIHTSYADPASAPSAAQVLHMATLGGARSAMLEAHTGSIEVGKAADLLLLNTRNHAFMPRNDLAQHLVYCENGSSIERVWVAGRLVFADGCLRTVDEAAVFEEIGALLPEYLAQHSHWEAVNKAFEPAFAQVIRRCAEVDVGVARWGHAG